MDDTRLSLLTGVGDNTPDAWRRLDEVYRPFLVQWFKAKGVPPSDADDLTQDVLMVLMDQIAHFRHSGRVGAFRTWLRGVCTNRLLGYLRGRRTRAAATGGEDSAVVLAAMPDPATVADPFDEQHDRMVLGQLFRQVSDEFAPTTMQAFRRLAFDAQPAPAVAAELRLSLGAVYIAKSRVMGRLRQLASVYVDAARLS